MRTVPLTAVQFNQAKRRDSIVTTIGCPVGPLHAVSARRAYRLLCAVPPPTFAAADARNKAIEAYVAYRRAGGESQSSGAQLCAATAQAIAEGKTDQARTELGRLRGQADLPPWAEVLIPVLQAILSGNRDPALADDPDLDYDDAVEVRLLLEEIEKRSKRRNV